MIRGIATLWAVLLLAIFATNKSFQQQQSQQREQSRQQQQPAAAAAILVAEESQPASFGNNGEYSSLVADNLINLGQPVFNNKRARKMSAFMPMRGRRDRTMNNDNNYEQQQQQQQSLSDGEQFLTNAAGQQQQQQQAPLLLPLFREGDGESSIMRLVMANQNNNIENGQLLSPSTTMGQLTSHLGQQQQQPVLFGFGTPAPRQFANQFAVRHLMMAPSSSSSLTATNNNNKEPISLFDGSSLSNNGGSGESNNQIMQAKLRRAFHPMRGKKSILPAGFIQEISYPEDMQTD